MQGYAPKRVTCINAASADETLGVPVFSPGYALQTYFIQGNGTTSSGVITIEECSAASRDAPLYTGTWSTITTINASDVTGDAQKAVHISATANCFTRARISTVIGGGGTVSVFLHTEGN